MFSVPFDCGRLSGPLWYNFKVRTCFVRTLGQFSSMLMTFFLILGATPRSTTFFWFAAEWTWSRATSWEGRRTSLSFRFRSVHSFFTFFRQSGGSSIYCSQLTGTTQFFTSLITWAIILQITKKDGKFYLLEISPKKILRNFPNQTISNVAASILGLASSGRHGWAQVVK